MRTTARVATMGLIASVALGATLAGCGDDGPARTSRAEMVRRADAICARGLEEADRLREEADPGSRGRDAADEIEASLVVLDRQIDGLAALRGPAATDAAREEAVRRLRVAAEGLESLRVAALDGDLTVDEAIRANPDVVERVNRASAQASDALVDLGFFGCVGLTG